MSEFSGKCDIYDDMFTINKITDFSNVHIYVGDHPIELRINSVKDLIPYYPFVAGIMTCSNKEYSIWIGDEPSYVREEWNMLETDIKYIKRIYNRFKRNKRKITVDSIFEECKPWLWNWKKNEDTLKELVIRVIESKGKDIRFKDLQLDYSQYYRQKLYEEMLANGYSKGTALKWCYGWKKAIELGMGDKVLD